MPRAETLYRRSLELWEKSVGPEHPRVMEIISRLAEVCRHMKQFAEAEILYRRSLTSQENSSGGSAPGVLTILERLALVLIQAGKFKEADDVETRIEALRPSHARGR
jgi:tetratricopeptide repeat protein